jgi:RNA recognition motif-containing protein
MLQGAFASCGGTIVSVKCFSDKRFGFVRFATVEEATKAMGMMQNHVINGNVIHVKYKDATPGSAPAPAASIATPSVAPMVNGEPLTGTRVVVEGVPSASSDDLTKIFGQYVKVLDCQVITLGHTSIALLLVPSSVEAQWLVQNLNGNIPQGLSSHVEVSMCYKSALSPKVVPPPATPLGGRTERSSYGKATSSVAPQPAAAPYTLQPASAHPKDRVAPVADPNNSNLFVWSLPVGIDEDGLRLLFDETGTILSIKCVPEKRYGFVKMSTVEEAQHAIGQINGLQIDDSTIKCKLADRNRT